jgi:hypothetical protein
MNRVQEIKEAREVDFYKNRMKDSHALKKSQARVEIEKGEALLAPAAAKDREKVVRNVLEKQKEKKRTIKKADDAMVE